MLTKIAAMTLTSNKQGLPRRTNPVRCLDCNGIDGLSLQRNFREFPQKRLERSNKLVILAHSGKGDMSKHFLKDDEFEACI